MSEYSIIFFSLISIYTFSLIGIQSLYIDAYRQKLREKNQYNNLDQSIRVIDFCSYVPLVNTMAALILLIAIFIKKEH